MPYPEDVWKNKTKELGILDRNRNGDKSQKNGMKIIEVPSFESPRISGQAKLNSYRDGWLILKIIVAERFRS